MSKRTDYFPKYYYSINLVMEKEYLCFQIENIGCLFCRPPSVAALSHTMTASA